MSRLFALLLCLAGPVWAAPPLQETIFWAAEVNKGNLPPIAERLPDVPLIVELEAKGRSYGTQGGTLRTFGTRSKDVRLMSAYGYARLVGYTSDYTLSPDILRDVEVTENRKFTLHLRPGHRWSDGAAFTSEDFRYWWENVAQDPDITPSGPPDFMFVDGVLGTVNFPDPQLSFSNGPPQTRISYLCWHRPVRRSSTAPHITSSSSIKSSPAPARFMQPSRRRA